MKTQVHKLWHIDVNSEVFFSPSVLILTQRLAVCSKVCHCYCNLEFLCYGVGTEVVSVIVQTFEKM